MAAGDLTSLETACAWMGVAPGADDANLARAITAVSAAIKAYLGWQVLAADYDRTFDGTGGRRLLLPDTPVTAIASVMVDGVAVPAATGVGGAGYRFDADGTVWLAGLYGFTRGIRNVEVAYTAGLASVPADLEQACLELVKVYYLAKEREPGIVLRRAGDTEERYEAGGASLRVGAGRAPAPASALLVLAQHRKVALL